MALRALSLLMLVENCFGASSHSMKYFYTGISDPSQGQPHFAIVGYVDGQVFVHYDSNSRKMQPRVSWMEKVVEKDPQYWDSQTQISRGSEEAYRADLETLRNHYNQSEEGKTLKEAVERGSSRIPSVAPKRRAFNHDGLHTWQWMYGCELQRDGSKGGFMQYGYNGRTFITFDKEILTWVAPVPQAQITQRRWDGISGWNQRKKSYLEETCIEWLEKYLSYGNETLLRKETPKVTLRRRTEVKDGMETHVCRVDGFYPREIDASWTRDGEVWLEDTFHGSVSPNADGTYHYWISVRIDPKERGRYRCHVEHDGLQDPLDLELKEPTSSEPTSSKSNLGVIIGCVVTALVLVCVIAGIVVFFKRRQDGYKAASTSDKGSNSSGQGSIQTV